ncbi:DUF3090 domain-containing protein [soil metagenome]
MPQSVVVPAATRPAPISLVAMPVIDFDPPERFIADTVGPPGQRAFFLQASRGARVTTVSLEKEQVGLLGERLGDLLDEVTEGQDADTAADAVADNAPLDTPIEDDFRAQSLSLAWDAGRRVVVIEAHERSAEESVEDEPTELTGEDEEVGPGQIMRVVLDAAHARAFARRCTRVVKGGRPNCPFCGQPLDPRGHVCPRANGYKR